MSDKPTGVFVRLPLSGEDCMTISKHITSKCLTNDGIVNVIRAIGTPVTGGELEVVGYEFDVKRQGCTNYSRDVGRKIGISGFGIEYKNITPLVRQSDALAKLAEKDAEIARLWSALDDIEMGIDALPDELECGDRMTAREMQRQALIIVKEEMKALKGTEA